VVSFADDRLDRPYLDGSARVGQCRPSPLAGAIQHLGSASALTSCMPCSFGPLRSSRSGGSVLVAGPCGVTVTIRYVPLVTTAYGTWVARPPAGGPEGEAHPRCPPPRGQEPGGLAAVAHRNLNCPRGVLAGALLASTGLPSWADVATSSHPVPAHPGVSRRIREQSCEHQGFRSRLVADASGAPVLGDQGPIGRPGTARPIPDLEHRELGKHCRPAKAVLVQAEWSARAGTADARVDRSRPFLRHVEGTLGCWCPVRGADAVVWRCSDQASFVTRATLPVDGTPARRHQAAADVSLRTDRP
jgi:hypothetical protein